MMSETEYSDLDHLTRLRIVLAIMREIIPFGTLATADLQSVTRTVAKWVQDLELAVSAHCGDEDAIDVLGKTPERADPWIPVHRRLPKDGEPVLIVYQEGRMASPAVGWGSYDVQDGRWSCDLFVGDGGPVDGVSHWRPIPALPKPD